MTLFCSFWQVYLRDCPASHRIVNGAREGQTKRDKDRDTESERDRDKEAKAERDREKERKKENRKKKDDKTKQTLQTQIEMKK